MNPVYEWKITSPVIILNVIDKVVFVVVEAEDAFAVLFLEYMPSVNLNFM